MMQETVILCVILFVCGIVVCQDILDPTVTNSSTVFQNSTSPVPDTTTALRGTEEDYIPICVVNMQQGECTPYYLCANDSTIIEYGSVERKIITSRQDNTECPLLKPCCVLKGTPTILPPSPTSTGCGFRHPVGLGFQFSNAKDRQAQEAEFPWTTAIYIDSYTADIFNTTKYQCGGSLIHPRVVLTAAHCIHPVFNATMTVRAGDWDSSSEDEYYKHQDRKIEEIIVHEGFLNDNLINDIALIILKEPMVLTENVNTVCLPMPDELISLDTECYATGWGHANWSSTTIEAIMKKIQLPLVASDKCQAELRKSRLGIHFRLHNTFICAGGGKENDTCTGDGGSPLMCLIPETNGQFVQSGITTWGIGCGEKWPGVYVNVAHFRKWIDQKMFEKRFDNKSYLRTSLDQRFGDV